MTTTATTAATAATIVEHLTNIRRDLRTLVARDDEGLGWSDEHAAYLLDLEAANVALLREMP